MLKILNTHAGILCLDIGVHTGFAVFDIEKKPIAHGVISENRKVGDAGVIERIAERCAAVASLYSVGEVIAEGVESWGASAKSNASISSGNLFQVAYMLGAIRAKCLQLSTVHTFTVVNVTTWKGQLPKAIVLKRIKKITGMDFCDHEGDAVGIGLWKKNLL